MGDGKIIKFGNDQDVTLTHVADVGVNLKSIATADDKPVKMVFQTGETDIAVDDILGGIYFQAPDEATGTDAILVAAGIEAVSEGDFSSSNNATKISFKTGASETATEKMSLSSGGNLTVSGNIVTSGGTISGKMPMITKSDDYTLGADNAQEAYGYMVWMTGDGKILTLPAVAAGMSVCVYSADSLDNVVDPKGSDGIRNGTTTRNAEGHKITSGATDEASFVCLVKSNGGSGSFRIGLFQGISLRNILCSCNNREIVSLFKINHRSKFIKNLTKRIQKNITSRK
jgi:hypothetical protein